MPFFCFHSVVHSFILITLSSFHPFIHPCRAHAIFLPLIIHSFFYLFFYLRASFQFIHSFIHPSINWMLLQSPHLLIHSFILLHFPASFPFIHLVMPSDSFNSFMKFPCRLPLDLFIHSVIFVSSHHLSFHFSAVFPFIHSLCYPFLHFIAFPCSLVTIHSFIYSVNLFLIPFIHRPSSYLEFAGCLCQSMSGTEPEMAPRPQVTSRASRALVGLMTRW